jgi:hypothetical protein
MGTPHAELTLSLTDAFNALADEAQGLNDRRIVLEHKLRFAHEQVGRQHKSPSIPRPERTVFTSPSLHPPNQDPALVPISLSINGSATSLTTLLLSGSGTTPMPKPTMVRIAVIVTRHDSSIKQTMHLTYTLKKWQFDMMNNL